jgi:hypothetical protein
VRVLIFRPGALGDALLALPALALLRGAAPHPHITLVARADILPLARAAGLADETWDFDLPCWSALWQVGARLRSPAVEALRGADAAIAWCADDGALTRSLRAHGVREVVVAPGRPPASRDGDRACPGDTHTALYLARTLGPLLPGGPPVTIHALPSIAEDLARAADATTAEATLAGLALPPGRIVALHPGSGGDAKRWPAERFATTARRLLEASYAPLLLSGPADDVAIEGTTAGLGTDAGRVPVARGLPLAALVGVLRRCLAYLGNDSGVSHLAGLAGTPTLALFGPTDPAVWAPLGARVRVLRATAHAPDAVPAMASLSVERVWQALCGLMAAP